MIISLFPPVFGRIGVHLCVSLRHPGEFLVTKIRESCDVCFALEKKKPTKEFSFWPLRQSKFSKAFGKQGNKGEKTMTIQSRYRCPPFYYSSSVA